MLEDKAESTTKVSKPVKSGLKTVNKDRSSVSMQRAIDRVSKEREVTKSKSTVQKKKVPVASQNKAASSKPSTVTKKSKGTTSPRTPVSSTRPQSPKAKARKAPVTKETRDENKQKQSSVRKNKIGSKSSSSKSVEKEERTGVPENKVIDSVAIASETLAIDKNAVKEKSADRTIETESAKQPGETSEAEIDREKMATSSSAKIIEKSVESEGRDARDITRKMISDILRDGDDELSFEHNGYDVPVSYSAAVTFDMALSALDSSAFIQWQNQMSRVVGTKRLEIRHVEIHSVDYVDDSDLVDMIKINSACALIDDELKTEEEIFSGVCYLRDNNVALLIELFCVEDESSWTVLVDHPRIPIGSVSALELPVGRVDEDEGRLVGFEISEIEEAFGLQLSMYDLTNLTKEVYGDHSIKNELGMCPSPGQSGEQVRIMHLRKEISKDHLLLMRSKFSEKREEGAIVSLRVVPLTEMWKVSADMKVMCALFLWEKANSAQDIADDESVSVRGRRLVSSVISNVTKPLASLSSIQ